MGVAVGLDMGTVMQMGAARRVDTDLLAAVLPDIEHAILTGRDSEGEEGDAGEP